MNYREFIPCKPLQSWVRCIWTLESPSLLPSAPLDPIIPDGRPELIINLGDPVMEVGNKGQTYLQSNALIAGQQTGPVTLKPLGRLQQIGVRFHSAGARALLKIPMNQITGRILELEAICRGPMRTLAHRLADDCFGHQTLVHLQSHLLKCIGDSKTDEKAAYAAQRIWHSRGKISSRDLALQTGLGLRQFERRFRAEVGLGPKALARVVRLQHLLNLSESSTATTWSAMAIDCGYYDQAHLIRDFKTYAGLTPSMFQTGNHSLSRLFSENACRDDFFQYQDSQPD